MAVSVVIPAHNESAVIGHTLGSLLEDADPGELEVVVVANGCDDDTADVARAFGDDVRVVETDVASKTVALNLGDSEARAFPRVYLDADIAIGVDTVRKLARALDEQAATAVSPTMRVDVTGRPWSVRAYYRVWTELPYVTDAHLAGVFALSRAGRARFEAFPDVMSDDLFVRGLFEPDERIRLEDCSYVVQAPFSLRSLLQVKTRSYVGTVELGRRYPDLARRARGRGGIRGRFLTIARRPELWPALTCYVLIWSTARTHALWALRFGRTPRWYRDESTRRKAAGPTG